MKFFIVLTSSALVYVSPEKQILPNREDSLYEAYTKVIFPKDKIPILWGLIQITFDSDLRKSLEFPKQYLTLCQQYGTYQEKAKAYWIMGWVNDNLENHNTALEFYLKA